MTIGDTKRLIVQLRTHGEDVQIAHYFRARTAPADPEGLVTAFRTEVETELRACLSNEISIVGYGVQDFIPGTALTYQTNVVPNLAGTVVQQSDIPQAAGVISWFTDLRGAGNRGRTFMPGLPSTFAENGAISAAGLAAYDAYATALIDYFDATGIGANADWVMVLWRQHMTGAGAVEPNPPAGQPGHVAPVSRPPFNALAAARQITSHLVRNDLRTQRRRGLNQRIN